MSVKVGDRVQHRETIGLSFHAAMARGRITKIDLGMATVDWKLPRGIPVPDEVSRQVAVAKLELVS
jgi:hypothetical protein